MKWLHTLPLHEYDKFTGHKEGKRTDATAAAAAAAADAAAAIEADKATPMDTVASSGDVKDGQMPNTVAGKSEFNRSYQVVVLWVSWTTFQGGITDLQNFYSTGPNLQLVLWLFIECHHHVSEWVFDRENSHGFVTVIFFSLLFCSCWRGQWWCHSVCRSGSRRQKWMSLTVPALLVVRRAVQGYVLGNRCPLISGQVPVGLLQCPVPVFIHNVFCHAGLNSGILPFLCQVCAFESRHTCDSDPGSTGCLLSALCRCAWHCYTAHCSPILIKLPDLIVQVMPWAMDTAS